MHEEGWTLSLYSVQAHRTKMWNFSWIAVECWNGTVSIISENVPWIPSIKWHLQLLTCWAFLFSCLCFWSTLVHLTVTISGKWLMVFQIKQEVNFSHLPIIFCHTIDFKSSLSLFWGRGVYDVIELHSFESSKLCLCLFFIHSTIKYSFLGVRTVCRDPQI